MPNIAEEWKECDGDLRLVRSKWEWSEEFKWTRVRTTWDPKTSEYAQDGKASGLDAVFSSRLPVPFRIGSLENPEEEHKRLLTLILQPIAEKIKRLLTDENSDLSKSILRVGELAGLPVEEEKENLNILKGDINKLHNAIFPDLKLDLDIALGIIDIKPDQLLLQNSKLKFTDFMDKVSWSQQGTGSQRALFWTMLQVRSRLKKLADLEEQKKKTLVDYEKQIKKLQDSAATLKSESKKIEKLEEASQIQKKLDELLKASTPASTLNDDLSLPGYMLIIDEPEIALHPNAVRSASRYLYGLAEDPSWQVMLATHSPLFIDPLQDHTTIVRFTRSGANPTPKTYRSDSSTFSSDDKENLKILNRFDTGLAEMFFGPLPILIEGDTEFASFEYLMDVHPNEYPLNRKPVLVRARGKHTLLLIMQILRQFKVDFAVLHDADAPYNKNGGGNGTWTANANIYNAIKKMRAEGIRVTHRISVPAFEYSHFPVQHDGDGSLIETPASDKPWNAIKAIKSDESCATSVLAVLNDLTNAESPESLLGENFMEDLKGLVQGWAKKHAAKDKRFGLTEPEQLATEGSSSTLTAVTVS